MTNKHDRNLLGRMRGNGHAGSGAVVDGSSKIEINVGGNVQETLADHRAIPEGNTLARLKHALVGGLIGLGQQDEQLKQAILAVHQRLIDVEDVLVALEAEGKLGVADPDARMALKRMTQGVFGRKNAGVAAQASAPPSNGGQASTSETGDASASSEEPPA